MVRSGPKSPPLWSYKWRIEIDRTDKAKAMLTTGDLAGLNNIEMATKAFEHACQLFPDDTIFLMHGTRVMERYPNVIQLPLQSRSAIDPESR